MAGFDLHVFLSHPHQGNEWVHWDMRKLYYEEFPRMLMNRVGFPKWITPLSCEMGVADCVFTQDKGRYYICSINIDSLLIPTLSTPIVNRL